MKTHAKRVSKIMENREPGRFSCHELDFTNPEHLECIYAQFGSKEQLEQRYPNLNSVLKNTAIVPAEKQANSWIGFCNRAAVLDLGYDKISNSMYAVGSVSLISPADRLYITMELFNDQGELIARRPYFYNACHSARLELKSLPMSLTVRKNYRACIHATWEPKGSNQLRSMVANAEMFAGGEDLVESIIVEDPRHKVTPEGSPITIAFSRDATNMDYGYPQSYDKDKKEVRVFLNVKGSLKLKKDHTVSDVKNIGAILLANGFGDVAYLGKNTYGTPPDPRPDPCVFDAVFPLNGGKEIGWELEMNWHNNIPDSTRFNNRLHDFEFGFTYRCHGDESEHNFLLTSVKGTIMDKQDHVEIVSQLHIYWGCLAHDTLITMADGSEKKICDIRMGDMVFSPDRGHARVREVITGTEQEIYILRMANGREVRASENHPFKSEHDFISVIDLDTSSKLMTDWGLSPVMYCYPEAYNNRVYNLELEGADSFYANGIVSGTNHVQGAVNDLYMNKRLAIEPNSEIVAECKRLEEDFRLGIL